MPSIKIDSAELKAVLELTPASQNLMLVGKHGIGKSQILSAHFEALGIRVIPFFLGQMSDPGDLIGLMHKDEASGRSEFLPPYWWPEGDRPVVLFLDELNRARPEILQSVMDLTLNRTLAGKTLPGGSRVVAAINEGDEYQLTDLDPALVSRFNVYEFAPSVEDWLDWAAGAGLDARVIDFLQRHGDYLDGNPGSKDREAAPEPGADLEKTPDRRAWERVARLIEPLGSVEEVHIKAIAGVIGSPAAVRFARSLTAHGAVSAEDVLLRFAGTRRKLEGLSVPDLAALNDQLAFRVQQDGFTPAAKRKVLENTHRYLVFLGDTGHAEALAHFASLLERPRFEGAAQLLLADPQVLGVLTAAVQDIPWE